MTDRVTSITSSKLDFSNIKNSLKLYFQQQSEFADYDFEASGLNNILDVLAYNTHFNNLTANLALNEAFLTTAQLRSSVISHAESLGYTPRSKRAAIASLNLSISNTDPGRSPTVTLPAYTTFSTTIEGINYTFSTLEDYTATDDGGGTYKFLSDEGSENIPVYQGTLTTKSFIVPETDERQIYIIPDENVDTSTLTVKVYNSTTSASYVTYTELFQAQLITTDSTHFDIHEAPNGYYELHFGDGVTTGRVPQAGNKVVVQYLKTLGGAANGARAFVPTTSVAMDGQTYSLRVLVSSAAGGGLDKETIEGIKQNAPIAFASQQRLVTADDYRGQILANVTGVDDVIAWGGQDNIPPTYGAAYVSLNFADGVDSDQQSIIKSTIRADVTDNLSMMSIDTIFADPLETYLAVVTNFNYNPNLDATSIGIVETQVQEAVNNYFSDDLSKFNSVFRRSEILGIVDDLSPAILNSSMTVKMQRRFVPNLTAAKTYTIEFPAAISTTVDNIITSNTFTVDGQAVKIINEAVDGSKKIQLVNATSGTVVNANAGSFTAEGVITLSGLRPTAISFGTTINLTAVPASQSTIRASKNFLLNIDTSNSFALGTVDYQG